MRLRLLAIATEDTWWRSLPWYGDYDRARLGGKASLFRTSERSFVLVFPETSV